MHYLVDGYNLLFRRKHLQDNLQSSREALIRELNDKIMALHLDVTLVFDATFMRAFAQKSTLNNSRSIIQMKGNLLMNSSSTR